MPRKARRSADTQAVTAATGHPYGERAELIAAQQAIPLDQAPPAHEEGPQSGAASASPAAGAAPGAPPPDPMVEALSAAAQTPFVPVGLGAPGDDSHPLTGVEAPQPLGPRGPSVADLLEEVAVANADPTLLRYADRARARGL